MKTPKKNHQITGIFWMLIHCFLISNVVIIAKLLGKMGYPAVQVVFFQSFIAFLIILPFGLKKYGKNLLKSDKLHLHFLRAFFGVISLVIYFFALKFVNLNDARAIALFGPILTFIFGIFLLKEHVTNKKILALILSLIGGIIIVNPASPSFHSALFLVLIAMFLWSAIDLIIKKMSKSESTIKQLVFLTGLLSLFSLIPTIYLWKTPSGTAEISLLILIGLLFLLNIWAMFSAIKNANLTTIMPFDFSGMVFTAILSYLIFSEIISLNTLVGSLVVFASSLYLIYHENKATKELAKIAESNISKE